MCGLFCTGQLHCSQNGGLYHRHKCYTIPHLSSSSNLARKDAVAECAKIGAMLAEIHDRTLQNALHDFVLTKMPSGKSVVELWMGMQYTSSVSSLI